MVAEANLKSVNSIGHDDSGQSVTEFLLVLPLLITLLMLIIRVNTVIQMSIVDQKYARQQALYVAGNAAEYPLRSNIVADLAGKGMNQLVLGVSEHQPKNGETDSSHPTTASTYYIGRKPAMSESNEVGDEIRERLTVRVRNTVTLCLPMITFDGKPALQFNATSPGVDTKYNLPEDPRAWKFCSERLGQRT